MSFTNLSPQRALELAEVCDELGRVALGQLRILHEFHETQKVLRLRRMWAARLAQAYELKEIIKEQS